MADGDGAGEKTEAPTPKRLRDARRDGTVAQSRELTSWAAVLAAVVVGQPLFGMLADRFTALPETVSMMAPALAEDGSGAALWEATVALSMAVAGISLAAWAAAGAVGVLVGVAQTRGLVAFKQVKPKWKALSPKEGVKKLVGSQAAWELAKQIMKLTALTVAAWPRIESFTDQYASGALHDPLLLAGVVVDATIEIVRDLAIVALVVALADYAWNRRKVTKQLRMTRQQVIDEFKNTEGDPQVKAQRRAIAQQMSRNRMIAAAGKASVVVVNPEHVAVALTYEPGGGSAPLVVARGGDALAARIREAARAGGVPIVRDVPLARTLYAVCRVGEPIPTELFVAVAHTLALVMRAGRPLSGTHRPPRSALGGPSDRPAPGPEPTRRTYLRSRRRKDGPPA